MYPALFYAKTVTEIEALQQKGENLYEERNGWNVLSYLIFTATCKDPPGGLVPRETQEIIRYCIVNGVGPSPKRFGNSYLIEECIHRALKERQQLLTLDLNDDILHLIYDYAQLTYRSWSTLS